jgi:Amt family ammonium transporter
MVGVVMTGIFATKLINGAGNDGLFFGNATFFWIQIKTLFIAVGYSFFLSYIIFKLVNFIEPIRVTSEEEELGLDESQHSENYTQGTLLSKEEFIAS